MKKRLLKFYKHLFHNPRALFPPTANSQGASVLLWPNGQNEIWIQGACGQGFTLTASEGPAGLALHISTHVGSPPISISGNKAGDYECFSGIDARHISLCQYYSDAKSQAFKAWYQADAATRGDRPSMA